MTEPSIFFSEVNERQGVFHRRAFVMGALVSTGLLALGGRLAELQIFESGRYRTLAGKNQYNFRMVPPPRGRILDRNGVELASNRPNFRLLLLKDQVNDVDATLKTVAELIPITPQRHRQLLREITESQKFVPVSLADDLTWDEFARVNVRTPELVGLQADMGDSRVYPFAGAFAHVVGYVSRVSDSDLAKIKGPPDPLLLNPGFRIGKQGVEKALDLDLRGKPGGQKVEVDSKGRVVREDPTGDLKAIPGKDVVLTLDADIQNRALEVFGEESGAAVMMDCRTGDILCMMSAPAFDANKFVKGISAADYRALADYDRKPLFNKALTATYPPGSTFKTMVALAALEAGVDPNRTYTCNGVFNYGGHPYKCDKHHGTLNMHGAIVTSCDVFFYQTALSVGPDKIAEVARHFGLGQIFDIGIQGQKPGIVPDIAWKKAYMTARHGDPRWYSGETPSMGIGQGYVNLNALQICVQASRLANGTKALLPRLIHSVGGVVALRRPGAGPAVQPGSYQLRARGHGFGDRGGGYGGGGVRPGPGPHQDGRQDRHRPGGPIQGQQPRPTRQRGRLGNPRPRLVHRLRPLRQPALRPQRPGRTRRVRRRGGRAAGPRDHARGPAQGPGNPRADRKTHAVAGIAEGPGERSA